MDNPEFQTVSIIGVGLLGGSIAKGLKKRGVSKKIIGIGRNLEKLQSAKASGIIDEFTDNIEEGIKTSDAVIICTPVSLILEFLQKIVPHIKNNCLITDVGSTKKSIVIGARKIMSDKPNFIGSHPMAGSEKSGAEFSNPDLYKNATCVLTPDEKTPRKIIDKASKFWKSLEANVIILNPDKHDELIAAISHIPHLSSVSLSRLVYELGEDMNLIKSVVGNGFRDTTRTAQGSPQMWKDIYIDNKEAIVTLIDKLINILTDYRDRIKNEDEEYILKKLSEIREFRKKI